MCAERRTRGPDIGGRSEHAAAATEFVIILPVMLLLVFGTLAIGAAFFQQLSLTEGAREGARYGATLRTGAPDDNDISGVPTDQWLAAVANVATSTSGRWERVCVSYSGTPASFLGGGVFTKSLRLTNGGGQTPGTTPCFDDGRDGAERRVQVVVTNSGPFDNFFTFRRTLRLQGSALARFERPYTVADL
jgi:Flp pilus assembly protein TadG